MNFLAIHIHVVAVVAGKGESIAWLANKADEQSAGKEESVSATKRAKHGALYNRPRERQSILTNSLRGSCRASR
jgi:hypothetical protein